MRIVRFLAAAALVAVAALQTTAAVAQLPPTRFYGTVVLNDEVPSVDTLIEAYVGGLLCGEGFVQDLGEPIGVGYWVDVFADAFRPGCGIDGGEVSFRVAGVPAAELGTFSTGGFVELNLTASGEPVAAPFPPGPPEPENLPPPVMEPQPEPEPQPEVAPEPQPEPAPEPQPEG